MKSCELPERSNFPWACKEQIVSVHVWVPNRRARISHSTLHNANYTRSTWNTLEGLGYSTRLDESVEKDLELRNIVTINFAVFLRILNS